MSSSCGVAPQYQFYITCVDCLKRPLWVATGTMIKAAFGRHTMTDQRSVEEGTLTRQDPVLSPKTLYRTAAPPSGYETENSTHYLKMASSELSSFIAISLIIKTTYRCHLTVK